MANAKLNIPDLSGKTALVTGANTGIGRVTAETLAKHGARVWLACRTESKMTPVVQAIRASGGDAQPLVLDLGDLASVRRAAKEFLDSGESLHILVNNAGLAGSRGLTKNGFELTFGTNHLGPFLLTTLLLERIEQSGTAQSPARIVNVASRAHYKCEGIDWDAQTKPTVAVTALPEYSVSKLANVLFSNELARRVGPNVRTYSLHPGVVATDVWRQIPWPFRSIAKSFMISEADGAVASLRCATDPALASQTGRYYTTFGVEKTPSKLARDEALARELWTRSQAWVDHPPQ